jgi:hypothetical protein
MCLKSKFPWKTWMLKIFLIKKYPVKILETSERVTRNKRIKMCKVQWSHHTEEEATWEREEEFKVEFLNIFSNLSKSRGRDSFKGVGLSHPKIPKFGM